MHSDRIPGLPSHVARWDIYNKELITPPCETSLCRGLQDYVPVFRSKRAFEQCAGDLGRAPYIYSSGRNRLRSVQSVSGAGNAFRALELYGLPRMLKDSQEMKTDVTMAVPYSRYYGPNVPVSSGFEIRLVTSSTLVSPQTNAVAAQTCTRSV